LVLVGIASSEYKAELESLANTNETDNFLEMIDFTPYGRLPSITSTCHIGIAIFTSKDIMNSTLGTASNKIYEYIACGLPIIYYDTAYFREHLGKYEWAIPTDLSPESLKKAIHHIATNFDELSQKAIESFENELNFEKYFSSIASFLRAKWN
jgi:glycosyltransferase involved in cell wall biosynthesis